MFSQKLYEDAGPVTVVSQRQTLSYARGAGVMEWLEGRGPYAVTFIEITNKRSLAINHLELELMLSSWV